MQPPQVSMVTCHLPVWVGLIQMPGTFHLLHLEAPRLLKVLEMEVMHKFQAVVLALLLRLLPHFVV